MHSKRGKNHCFICFRLGEMAVPTLAAIFLEINALVIATMIVCFVAHEATAYWDVSYASGTREVIPIEQQVHSLLEMLPADPRDAALAAIPGTLQSWSGGG
jgi:hypothetical protein